MRQGMTPTEACVAALQRCVDADKGEQPLDMGELLFGIMHVQSPTARCTKLVNLGYAEGSERTAAYKAEGAERRIDKTSHAPHQHHRVRSVGRSFCSCL